MALVERADLTNITLASGAGSNNIIHPEFANDIIKSAAESSIALRRFQTRRVPTGQLSIPVLSALPTAYWVNEDYTTTAGSGSKKPTTEAGWVGVVLRLAELAAIVPIPLAVLEDAAGGGTDLWAEIRPYVGQAIAMKIDGTVFFGKSTGNFIKPAGWPDGIVHQAIAAHGSGFAFPGASTSAALTAINGAMSAVEATGYDPNRWTAARSFRGGLRGLISAGDGQPVYLSSFRSDSRTDELLGTPIDYANSGTGGGWDSSVADAVVGDDSAVILGVSTEGMRVDMLKEATLEVGSTLDGTGPTINLAQQNMVALRMSFRVAYQTAVSVTVKGDGTFPFAALV